jgi:hypothetical protein
MDLLEEKVTKKRVDISDHFPEFAEASEVRKYVDKFGADSFNLSDVKSFILYLFLVKIYCRTIPCEMFFQSPIPS